MVNSVLLTKRTLCSLISLTFLVCTLSYLKQTDNKKNYNFIAQSLTKSSNEEEKYQPSSTSESSDLIPSSSFTSTTSPATTVKRKPTFYAAISVDTPNGTNSLNNPLTYSILIIFFKMKIGETYRGYDYAFALPLDALAWERVGFRTAVTIVGARCQWENDPALKVILNYLEDRNAVIIFLESKKEYRSMLGQTSRIFLANFEEFPGL